MSQNAEGDKIFNGADDDGSGTVGTLAIAQALSKSPTRPKRSVIFVWHAGEEKGLWGSEFFTDNPTEDVNNSYLKLAFNYKYDDPSDTERFFYRSDHYNYAKKGVPIIFYFSGVHEDYHGLADTADKIDYQKMEKVTRTVFAMMWRLANAPARPKVDKPLTPQMAN